MPLSDQDHPGTPVSARMGAEQAHAAAQRALCGDRARDGSFEWVCNLPAAHDGRHRYKTPNGESQVSWDKIPAH